MTWHARIASLGGMLPILAGCGGVQSALETTGREAADIYFLFIVATALSIAITLLVLVLLVVVLWGPSKWRDRLGSDRVVIGGGVVLPIVLLSLLLGYGLFVLDAGASRTAHAKDDGITIVGKRWWWEVAYATADGEQVVSANELRLPVGRPVTLHLESDNVIHSFWAPQLAGKLDMIPGRTNSLVVEATEPGVSRGQCAEYCGGAHALMAFFIIAMPPDEYDAWLQEEAAPARAPETGIAQRGQALFLENGCGACHTVRGTQAGGTIGPDLTHVGSRRSLAAATLPNDAEAFARWIKDNQHIKPENLMPPYENLEPDDLTAIAAYLEGLD
ncbi:cytochrome c oxidase subunit II [Nitratireductor luteus]|uniref:cytochrome c oxidase subunit II n=1 Tax=Nitratireductor luteus TaxID=2976980 RepID=UPI00224033C9|nr:cytochrome c oxidase subunit II [Nitratireductor luteus]